MSAYPSELTRRFEARIQQMMRDVAKLKTRTAGIDSGSTLAVLPAVIDPAYTTGDPKCLINGSAVLSGPFQHLASYTPAASDLVLVIPVPVTASGLSSSYIILGRVT